MIKFIFLSFQQLTSTLINMEVAACTNTPRMLIGVIAALAYIYLVFGIGHKCGQPTKIFNEQQLSYFKNGSFYVGGFHIHHWMIAWTILPIAVLFACEETSWFLFVVGAHGFTYPDAFIVKQRDCKQS